MDSYFLLHPSAFSTTGWLFDLYPQGNRMVLWFITDQGARLRLLDTFMPSFFVGGLDEHPRSERMQLLKTIRDLPGLEAVGRATRLDFWTGEPRVVGEIRVTNFDHYTRNLRVLARKYPGWAFFNCDISPAIHYCYERGIFPTARCTIKADGENLLECRVLDSSLDNDYLSLTLRVVWLRASGIEENAWPGFRSLRLDYEGESIEWDCNSPRDVLFSLNEHLNRIDPDLILTVGGDSLIMPALFSLAARYRVPLALDRERGIERRIERNGTSYMSYGQVLYHAPDYPLFGRWHIDEQNTLMSGEKGLHGLLEVARMSKIPVQRVARHSLGTGISSIQMDIAYREGYLIPWKKSQPEGWKTAALMIKSDRGGLVYQPVTGVYEDVIELDFVSMYPSIMERYNVSPETVNCRCCPPNHAVPELGYTLCRRREGLVAKAVGPIIKKRSEYKKRMRRAREEGNEKERVLNDGRQEALKGLLVCCFGYLGYRNARFGRIEAHEATCAFSREILLRAREICEDAGFEVIHAIVDCVWIRKDPSREEQDASATPHASDGEIESLCRKIERATNIDIAVEGRYRWVAFLPSRQNADLPVPNRYFGRFSDGRMKFRGIEVRRRDQAPYAKIVQQQLLDCLGRAESLAECRAMKEELIEILRAAENRLRRREVPINELLMRRRMSMEAEEYSGNNMTAVAARQAKRAGMNLHPGESIRFLVLDQKSLDPDSRLRLVSLLRPEDTYDVTFYIEQIRRAAGTVLEPILNKPLERLLGVPLEKRRKRILRHPCEPVELVQLDLFDFDLCEAS